VLSGPLTKRILDPRPFPQYSPSEGIKIYTHQGSLAAVSDLAIIENSPILKVSISIPEPLLYQDIQRVLRFLAIVLAVSFAIIVVVFLLPNT
jgi:hypothetical protein